MDLKRRVLIKDQVIWLVKSGVKSSPMFSSVLFIWRRKGGGSCTPPNSSISSAFLWVCTQTFFYFLGDTFYQIKFSIVLSLLFYLKNASLNQNNPMPRTKWERWFINNLWSLLWPFLLPCALAPICHNAPSVLPFIALPLSPSWPHFHADQIGQPLDLTSEYRY